MVFCITTGRYWACGHWIWSKTFKRIIYCPRAISLLAANKLEKGYSGYQSQLEFSSCNG